MTERNLFQDTTDTMSAERQRQRSHEQMTLGAAIKVLRAMPQDAPVCGLRPIGSYRGYYQDLAFGSFGDRTRHPAAFGWTGDNYREWGKHRAPPEAIVPSPKEYATVADVLADCESALGSCFEGYKGGDFWMTGATPLWVSGYGTASGDRLMGLGIVDGALVPVTAPTEES